MSDNISFSKLQPFVRYAQRLTVSKSSAFTSMRAYDNRFFYCTGGSGKICIEGNEYPMKIGFLIIWRAGLQYDLLCDGDQSLSMIGFNFDYLQNNCNLGAPIPPGKSDFDDKKILEHITFSDVDCFNDVIYLTNMQYLEGRIVSVLNEYLEHRSLYRACMSGLFLSILTEAARDRLLVTDNIRRSKAKVEQILKFISTHYSEEITNISLGHEFGYHPNYINHLVVQHTGMSLHKYVLSRRINRALDYLQTTDLPVCEISEKVGFSDYNHFLKYFKQMTGYTTKAFRNK